MTFIAISIGLLRIAFSPLAKSFVINCVLWNGSAINQEKTRCKITYIKSQFEWRHCRKDSHTHTNYDEQNEITFDKCRHYAYWNESNVNKLHLFSFANEITMDWIVSNSDVDCKWQLNEYSTLLTQMPCITLQWHRMRNKYIWRFKWGAYFSSDTPVLLKKSVTQTSTSQVDRENEIWNIFDFFWSISSLNQHICYSNKKKLL